MMRNNPGLERETEENIMKEKIACEVIILLSGIYARTQARTHTHASTHAHARTHTHTHTHTRTHARTHTHTVCTRAQATYFDKSVTNVLNFVGPTQ